MAKKKLNIKPKMPNGGKAPIKGTKEQYKWSDSKGNYDVVNSENPNVNLQNTNLKNTHKSTVLDPLIKAKNQLIYKAIQPANYPGFEDSNDGFVKNSVLNLFREREKEDPYSEDAWAKYLGLPQKNNSFTESKYRPSKSSVPNEKYYSLPQEFKDDLLNSILESNTVELTDENRTVKTFPPAIDYLKQDGELNYEEGLMPKSMKLPFGNGKDSIGLSRGHVLGNFKLGYGKDDKGDYISYYDTWDLDPKYTKGIDPSKIAGEPFEIYDRIYQEKNQGLSPNNPPKKADGGSIRRPVRGTPEQRQRYLDSLAAFNEGERLRTSPMARNFSSATGSSEENIYFNDVQRGLIEGFRGVSHYGADGHSSRLVLPMWKKPVQPIEGILEQPINIQSLKPDLLQGNNQQLEFNPIGFQKGTYFTRPRQSQEIGDKLEYFDKKTGKKLEFGGNIEIQNEKYMAKNGKKIKLKKAEIGKFMPNTPLEQDPEFRIGDQGFNEQPYTPIYNPNEFNPSLTYGLENYNQSKGYNFNSPSLSQNEQGQYNTYRHRQSANPWQDVGQQMIPSLDNLQNLPKATIPNITDSKWWAKADKKFQKGQELAVKAGQSVISGFTGGMGGGAMGGGKMPSFGKANGGFIPKKMQGGGLMSWLDAASYGTGAAASFAGAGMDTTGALLDTLGSANINNQVKQWENQNARQFAFNKAENLPPIEEFGYQFQGRNNALMEHGGMTKYKSYNNGGVANVEVENLETIATPQGEISTVYGDTHAEGGIDMLLPENTKVFSEKLKHPEKKKSFAKLAKKFETKKDFENLESPIADDINKFTADLNIQFKNKASDELFAEQENMKLNGVFGDKVKNNTMKDYEMKYGGLTKMDVGGVNYGALSNVEEQLGVLKNGIPSSTGYDNKSIHKLDSAMEKRIENTIGKDIWNKLPDNLKTQVFSFAFNNGVEKKNWLTGLAQAIDPSIKDRLNLSETDAIAKIKSNISKIDDNVYNNYINTVLPDQYNSIGDSNNKQEENKKLWQFRANNIDQYLNQNISTNTPPNTENNIFNYNFQSNKNKIDPTYGKMGKQKTPTGQMYNPPLDLKGWENLQSEIDLAHPNLPLIENNSGYYKDVNGNPIVDKQALVNLSYQEQFYDDMLETPKGRAELAKMWQDAGKTLKGKNINVDTSNLTSLNDKELYEKLNTLRPAYLDSYTKFRKGKYYNPNPTQFTPKAKKELVSDAVSPITDKIKVGNSNFKQFMPQTKVPFYQFDTFQRDPITSYSLDPQFVNPRYLDINPELSDINRDVNAITSLTPDRTGANIANIANIANQARAAKQRTFGTKYQYDKQQDQWAEGTNAQTKMSVDSQNLNNYIQNVRNPILQREATITQQKNINNEADLSRVENYNKDANTMAWMDKYYNPSANSQMPIFDPFTGARLVDVDKTVKKYDANGRLINTTTTDEVKKNGGKVSKLKLKTKIKKK